jgi:hypothetical protein
MQHLCSRTLKPSHTESFVDSWTSSLEDSRANLSALLERVKELTTRDTSSHTSEMASETANPELFSLKTLKELSQPKQETENQFSNMSSENWKDWVTEQRQGYSQRVKSAHLTKESGSSSWATPEAVNQVEYQVSNGKKVPRLGSQVKNWPTVQASEARQGYQNRNNGKKGSQKSLTTVVVENTGLQDLANSSTNGKSQESWPTPRANKVHPEITDQNREQLANRGKANLEEDVAGHCGKATGKLNPNWVEQLMGLRVGWTQLPTEWIDSDC